MLMFSHGFNALNKSICCALLPPPHQSNGHATNPKLFQQNMEQRILNESQHPNTRETQQQYQLNQSHAMPTNLLLLLLICTYLCQRISMEARRSQEKKKKKGNL
ncbi:hypothetical protein SAY86_008798 [Trapa natans]|uniref:Uncharacterized protein n=1 Tax=Trapa natans TaxID=22666 RepID=A0AAN7KHS7_TRANT|nr:hypothetical protein SAY86_008798 [Trapa natans]